MRYTLSLTIRTVYRVFPRGLRPAPLRPVPAARAPHSSDGRSSVGMRVRQNLTKPRITSHAFSEFVSSNAGAQRTSLGAKGEIAITQRCRARRIEVGIIIIRTVERR